MIQRVQPVTLELPLRRAFRIARGSTRTVTAHLLRVDGDDHTGWGCAHASPNVTGETSKQAKADLDALDPEDLDPDDVPGTLEGLDAGPSVKAAVDLALLDLAGRRANEPAHRLLGLPDGEHPSAATVTVADVDDVRRQAEQWKGRGYFVLKLKIDEESDVLEKVRALDEALPETVRDPLPEPCIWIDANEALTVSQAQSLLPHFADQRVALLEQPLPREEIDETALLAQDSPVPIVLDEAIQGPEDVRKLAGLEGRLGVNVKVQKVGGLHRARECLTLADEAGLSTLVGCNLETGLGIAAGSCLTGAVDWADLDGNLFLETDPFPLPRPKPGHAGTSSGPGLGVHPDPRFPKLLK